MVTAPLQAGVYVGSISHRRQAPVMHAFRYPLFMVLLDIDRVPELMSASPFTSYNRWNWASFHESDHFGDPARSLRHRLAADATTRGFVFPDGPVYALTHLRYLGYCFNPVSFFYCYDGSGALRLVLAEVNNTFGGSHNYWLAPEVRGGGQTRGQTWLFRASSAKSLYVSPFMPPDMTYAFAFTEPGRRLIAHMTLEQAGIGDVTHTFDANLVLDYRPWTGREIARTLLRHPMMTAHVIAGIHWEALKLWWKGLPVVPRPTPDGVHPEYAAPDAGRP